MTLISQVRCLIRFCTQNVATSEKQWAKSADFLVFDRGTLNHIYYEHLIPTCLVSQ